jgi:phage shock protein A
MLGDGEGVSGWTGYLFGKWAAERSASNLELMASIRDSLSGTVRLDPNVLAQQVQQLQAELAQVRSQLAGTQAQLERKHARLKEWQAYADDLERRHKTLSAWADLAAPRLDYLEELFRKYWAEHEK